MWFPFLSQSILNGVRLENDVQRDALMPHEVEECDLLANSFRVNHACENIRYATAMPFRRLSCFCFASIHAA
jgi:hypothetical protein